MKKMGQYILLLILNYSTELFMCSRVGLVFPKAVKVGELANSSHAIAGNTLTSSNSSGVTKTFNHLKY